jgi:hypothetical protein
VLEIGKERDHHLGRVLVRLPTHVLVEALRDPGRGVTELVGDDLDVDPRL